MFIVDNDPFTKFRAERNEHIRSARKKLEMAEML
jgi:hypothetical protein